MCSCRHRAGAYKKISSDFIYDRTELKDVARRDVQRYFGPTFLPNLFKDKQLKVIDSILRREDTVQVRHKKKIFFTPNAVFDTRNFIPNAVQCCIPSVKCTCQTTPNACRVKNHRYSEFLVCTGSS